MKRLIIIFLLAILFVMQSTTILARSETESELKATVDSLGNLAEKAFLAGDVDHMLTYYCDDVISMPNFHLMVNGKSDLKRMTEAIMETGIQFQSLESTTLEAQISGDLVYEIGIFTQVIVMPNSEEPIKQSGKYLTIWRKQPDGSLKIEVEMYNSDANPYGAERE